MLNISQPARACLLRITADGDCKTHTMMDRPQASEGVPTDVRTHRLYPSLPSTDRYDAYEPERATELKLQAALELQPEGQLGDSQSDASAASGHIKTRAQMLVLEEQRQELLSINEKWAKEYKTMVQYYKQKVCDLKALLQQGHSPTDELHEEEGRHVKYYDKVQLKTDKELIKSVEDSDAVSELLNAKEEARELRAQNHTLTRRGQHQQEEIQRLNKALKKAQLTSQPLGCSETLQDLWKHQAEVYKEDFLKERKDREKLKDKYLELKSRFIKVHNELCVFKPQVTWTPPQPVPVCACTRCSDRKVQQPRTQSHRRHTGDNQ